MNSPNKTTNDALSRALKVNEQIMTLPLLTKEVYHKELRQTARRLYELIQYIDPEVWEDQRYYEHSGEIRNPKELVPVQFIAGPPCGWDIVRTFVLGSKFVDEVQCKGWTGNDEKAMWGYWMRN